MLPSREAILAALRNAGTPVLVNLGGGNIQFNAGTYQAQVGGTVVERAREVLRPFTAHFADGQAMLVLLGRRRVA